MFGKKSRIEMQPKTKCSLLGALSFFFAMLLNPCHLCVLSDGIALSKAVNSTDFSDLTKRRTDADRRTTCDTRLGFNPSTLELQRTLGACHTSDRWVTWLPGILQVDDGKA